jgi:hypothetical protein
MSAPSSTRISVLLAALALTGAVAASGCQKQEQATPPTAPAGVDAGAAAAPTGEAATGVAPAGPAPGTDAPEEFKTRYRQPVVYLDGVAIGVLQYGELPPRVMPAWQILADGRKARRWKIADIIEDFGADLSKVKAVHLHGGRTRTVRIDGDELRRMRDRLLISFSRSTSGKARFHWPGADFKATDSIDIIQVVAVYQDKPPPTLNKETRDLELNGQVLDGPAYVEVEIRGGTRVYLDGRLSAVIKRNSLDPTTIPPGPGGKPGNGWPLLPMLKDLGATSLDTAKSVDLVLDEVFVGRYPAKILKDAKFKPVVDSAGSIVITPPGKTASALLFYAKKRPPDHSKR